MCFALQRIVKPSYCEHFENATVEAKISAKREVIPMVQSVLSFCALSFLWESNSFKTKFPQRGLGPETIERLSAERKGSSSYTVRNEASCCWEQSKSLDTELAELVLQ